MIDPVNAEDDLVERLNDEAMRLQGRGIDRGCVDCSLSGNLAMEAADRIEALEAVRSTRDSEIERLREALETIAVGAIADPADVRRSGSLPIKLTTFRMSSIARQALNQETPNVG